ncbi:hypothetical protein SAMN04487893_10464 [Myroides guanonis]|uniref:Uncharacterized protein n=2 Tax=Myroides guanonis TaxID=1150112 RepID=A0A1I3PC03_9FLAO|nr:hypothetical protein SAMN04487893_10464 [Myroides guanonis]
MNTYYWSTDTFDCPYDFIKELFDFEDIKSFKNEITYYFLYSKKEEVYSKRNASSVMFNCAILLSTLKACYNIYLEPEEFKKRKLIKSAVFYEDYCLSTLSREEYINPFLVFKKVFDEIGLNNLEASLFDTISYAMGDSYIDCISEKDIQIITYNKLLEACWLINERLKEKE